MAHVHMCVWSFEHSCVCMCTCLCARVCVWGVCMHVGCMYAHVCLWSFEHVCVFTCLFVPGGGVG